jgi:hypothetical protein
VRKFHLLSIGILFCITLFLVMPFKPIDAKLSSQTSLSRSNQSHRQVIAPPAPSDIKLDSRLPEQTFSPDNQFTNINAKFGSRFDFNITPSRASVSSGTDGVFHDNPASYIVGIAPTGLNQTSIFHMGVLNRSQGDSYVLNEHWIQGLNTTRWVGDVSDNSGMHIIVDFIDTFLGEPGCTAISVCTSSVRDDTVPVLIVGISLQNRSNKPLTGTFLFGSNRKLSPDNACVMHTTAGGNSVNILSYDKSSDATGGTLFLSGVQRQWRCNTRERDRAGLAWNYHVGSLQTSTAYLILGGWNASQNLFVDPLLSPSSCQHEGLYAAKEWSSLNEVVDFAFDNLQAGDRLLARAQSMENILINNDVLTPIQRWTIANTLRSYKSSTWLVGSRSCTSSSNDGYDAAVYEGSYGFLTTVDVMHDYGYFEITRVPWFFKSAISIVFKNATRDSHGIYFQHDQGGDVDSSSGCTVPGKGIPTIRSTCYAPPFFSAGLPMPVEENDNVTVLTAYYTYLTGDTSLATKYIHMLDAAMSYKQKVGDPSTGIAYNFQGTTTTYDAASDCLHNNAPGAGNLYYQGLKEVAGYRAAAYLDSLVSGNDNGATWQSAATKIENAMIQEYNSRGFIPLALNNNAFSNCDGRTIVLGEGLFYLHFLGLESTMNQILLQDLAKQYPEDLSADTLSSAPIPMIAVQSKRPSGPQCSAGHCLRYEWFSKVMLSGLVADLVYTRYGCTSCTHVNVVQTVYDYNQAFFYNFGDGLHDDGSDWGGHFYPRGIISWAFLIAEY